MKYRVGLGETPESIAKKLGGSTRELVRANPQLQRVRDGRLVTLSPGVGAILNVPTQWGLGASFRIIAGAVYVDAQIALAACQGGWGGVPTNWPSAMTQQAIAINGQATSGDMNYVYYDGKLYEFTSGGGNTWISRTCGSPNKLVIPGIVQIPITPVTPVVPTTPPGGRATPVVYNPPGTTTPTTTSQSSSNVLPIIIGVSALAAGVGLAYLVHKRKQQEEGKA